MGPGICISTEYLGDYILWAPRTCDVTHLGPLRPPWEDGKTPGRSRREMRRPWGCPAHSCQAGGKSSCELSRGKKGPTRSQTGASQTSVFVTWGSRVQRTFRRGVGEMEILSLQEPWTCRCCGPGTKSEYGSVPLGGKPPGEQLRDCRHQTPG